MAKNENNVVRNDELLEAVKEMRADFNAHTQSKVINMVLRSTFLVPAVINRNTQLVADNQNHLKFEDKPQAKFLLVKNQKTGGTFFPVFTDSDELNKMHSEENFQGVKMKFPDLATLTEQTKTVAGFVINPMSTNLPFTQEMLASIKKQLAEARAKRQAEQQAQAQGITMTSASDNAASDTKTED